jgi:hypothetical protein
MEEVALNDRVKYMNYINKLSEGTITRILRPDTIFVKDEKTHYEEKINKISIILNLTVFETNILDKISERYQLFNTIELTNFVSKNIDTIISIVNTLKDESETIQITVNELKSELKNELGDIQDSVSALKSESLESYEHSIKVDNNFTQIIILNLFLFGLGLLCNVYFNNYMNFKYEAYALLNKFVQPLITLNYSNFFRYL